WSTVVSQLEMRPRETRADAETGTCSALAATAASRVEALPQVIDRRVQLLVAPGRANGRHLDPAVSEQDRHRVAVCEQRALPDRGADVALAREPVAGGAHALEGLAPDLRRRGEPP